jgi:hypothetical protein
MVFCFQIRVEGSGYRQMIGDQLIYCGMAAAPQRRRHPEALAA